MNRTKIMRTYVNFSIVIGLYFLLAIFLYNNRLGSEFYGLVSVTLFNVNFETLFETITVFNMPLVAYFMFLWMNVLVFVLVGRYEEVEHQALKEVAIYNSILTLVMIAAQLVFIYAIPDRIGGLIENKYIFTDFHYTTNTIVRAFNFNYLLALAYIVYNMLVSVKTMPPKAENTTEYVDEVMEEEALLKQFLSED